MANSAYTRPTSNFIQRQETVVTSSSDVTPSASTWTDLTGITVTITPRATTSKVLVMVNFSAWRTAGTAAWGWRLVRGSTAIAVGVAASSRIVASGRAGSQNTNTHSVVYLDSPSTTSATTYKIQIYSTNSGGAITVTTNKNTARTVSAASVITVIEVGT